MVRIYAGLIALALAMMGASCTSLDSQSAARIDPLPKIIFDTDFGGDADDLGALAMLHDYADEGIIELMAIASWSNEEYAIPALAAVNLYYGRPNLPLGVREVEPWRTEWNYTQILAENFPYSEAATASAKGAVTLYRELLAKSEPHSITIVTVGPLANIQNLLQSPPDAISPLSGEDLFDTHVKQLVIMGGQFPDGITAHGPEWNFDGNMPGVTQFVLETVKRPIVLSGYEVGEALKIGTAFNDHPANTPLYVGYKYFSKHAPWMKENYQGEILDNSSFDQTAVMFAAINGVGDYWSLSDPGTLSADERGVGSWAYDEAGTHQYLILDKPLGPLREHIAKGMTHIPD